MKNFNQTMKLLPGLLCLSVISLVTPLTTRADTLLTFDDLSPGPVGSYVVLPNGYGGLQWSGFAVINGSLEPTSSGYRTGIVSPNNVAFNFDDINRTALSSSGAPFNFNSAWLTAGSDYFTSGLSNGFPYQIHGMQVEVQGFVGTHLTYDNTFSLQQSSPTFINFGYNGVNEVEFIPELPGATAVDNAFIFAMDNMSITTVPEPAAWTLLGPGAAIVATGTLRNKRKRLNSLAA